MAISPGFAALLALAGTAVVVNRRRRTSSSSASTASSSHQVIDIVLGPPADPCLGAAYSQTALPLIQEAFVNVKPAAQALYGERPVYYIVTEAQGQAFSRIAYHRVSSPGKDPVLLVAAELAPSCNWAAPPSSWSPAMLAFRSSLEKMTQVIDADIGPSPEMVRPHPWDTEMVLRNGKTLRLVSGSTFSFELPPGADTGKRALSVTVVPNGAASVSPLGLHDQALPDGKGGYALFPVYELQATLVGGSKSALLSLQTTTETGQTTSGKIELVAP